MSDERAKPLFGVVVRGRFAPCSNVSRLQVVTFSGASQAGTWFLPRTQAFIFMEPARIIGSGIAIGFTSDLFRIGSDSFGFVWIRLDSFVDSFVDSLVDLFRIEDSVNLSPHLGTILFLAESAMIRSKIEIGGELDSTG